MIETLISKKSGPGGSGSQVEFTTPGTYEWIVPEGVTSICAVCVAAGGGFMGSTLGGYGGDLRYVNDVLVNPGDVCTIVVPAAVNAGGRRGDPAHITINGTMVVRASCNGQGGASFGDGGGNGGAYGSFGSSPYGGGGGAGGYSGNGGNGYSGITEASGGGGGGGGVGRPGGGVGIWGEGPSGARITSSAQSGKAGSGGSGFQFGGGVGRNGAYGGPGNGAARIIWGENRRYPSTNTEDH